MPLTFIACPDYVIALNIVIYCPIGDEVVSAGESTATRQLAKKTRQKDCQNLNWVLHVGKRFGSCSWNVGHGSSQI